MFDRIRKMFSHTTSEPRLVRHTALTFRDGEIGFIMTEVDEAEFRRKLSGLKGELLLRAKPDGEVEALCNSCHVRLVVAQKDQLYWFRCPRCHGVSFDPTPNVNRDVQFAIQDGKHFEHESNYVRQLPPGLVPPFSAEEMGDAAWAKTPEAVIPLPDQPVGGTGAASLQKLEEAIAPYVQKARATYPDAKRRFLVGLPNGATFFTTIRLHNDAGRMEAAFVSVKKIDNDLVTGIIASKVDTVSGYRLGQAISFPETEVVDWTIANADGTQEGNVVGRFLATYEG